MTAPGADPPTRGGRMPAGALASHARVAASVRARRDFDRGELPGAGDLRRFVRDAPRTRAVTSRGDLVMDAAALVVGTVIAAVLLQGAFDGVRIGLVGPVDGQVGDAVRVGSTPAVLVPLVLLAFAGTVLSLAARLGPVALGAPAETWLLPLPVGRRGLLRPVAWRLPVVVGTVGALGGAVVSDGALGLGLGRAVVAGLVVGAGGAVLVAIAALAQSAGAGASRAVRRVGDAIVVAACAGLVLVAVAPGATWSGTDPVATRTLAVVGLALVVVTMLAGAWTDRRLDRFTADVLRSGSAAAARAGEAVQSFDLRALGRTLSDSAAPARRRGSARLRGARGPSSAVVLADVVVLRRSGRHLVGLVVALVLPILVTRVTELATPTHVLVVTAVSGVLACVAAGEPSRRAAASPGVDGLLPLSASRVVALRHVVPAAVLGGWSTASCAAAGIVAQGGWGAAGQDVLPWLGLGVLGAPVWAVATVRSAGRPEPDWDGPLVSTPAGAVPASVVRTLVRGPDVAVVGLAASWFALATGEMTARLAVVQAVLTLVVVAVAARGARVRPRGGPGPAAPASGTSSGRESV